VILVKRLVVAISTLAIVAGQATVASAAAKELPGVTKISANICALPLKSTKLAKAPRVENRCETDDHRRRLGVIPIVFGGAAIAGIVAVAVSTTNNNSATSP
jgi:hypothetical protein